MGSKRGIQGTTKKAEMSQSEGDTKLFLLARILQRNESRGVDLKEIRAANISCQSSSMATPFFYSCPVPSNQTLL